MPIATSQYWNNIYGWEPSSIGDVMLDSVFESPEALKNYSSHPAHVEVANGKVRPFVKIRSSFDYEIG